MLLERYPFLADRNRAVLEFPKELKDLHHTYISSVSTESMAVSLDLSVLMYALCRQLEPKSILDLGSGYSSAVLRYYAVNCPTVPKVVTVDDSSQWLKQTELFLSSHHLPTDCMIDWDSFSRLAPTQFDFIFYDLGHVRELRTKAFRQILQYAGPGGILVLDDMNFIGYRRYVKRILKKNRFESYSAECLAKDSIGRYPYILVAKK